MALDVQYISLDISKRPTPQQVRLGQGDANGTQLVVSVFDGGVAYSLSSYSVRLALRLPGSSDAYYEVGGTKSGNVATFNIDETYAASSYGADGFGYVDVMNGDTVICSTSRFQLVVLRSAEDGADPSTSYSSGIIEATEAANEAAERAIAAAEAAEGIILQDVPTMTPTIKGGAKLGNSVQIVEDALEIKLVDIASGESVTAADASYLNALTVNGKSVQDGTPTPSAPVPIQVVEADNGTFGIQIGDTVIPIDLQGNVLASLPDGTHDTLHIDSAGHVWIEETIGKVVFDGVNAGKRVNGVTNYNPNLRFTINPPNQKTVASNLRLNMFTDKLKVSTDPVNSPSAASSEYTIEMYNDYMFLILPSSALSGTTVADGNTWLQSNNANVLYPLATPATIDLGYIEPPAIPSGSVITVLATLTPTIVAAWWTSRAAAIPEALAASKQHIEDTSADDASIAPVESSTAFANHSVGALIMLDGMLYKVTTAIATGETITPGTNCTQTTVAAELAALA